LSKLGKGTTTTYSPMESETFLGDVDKIEAANSSKLNKRQQSSTSTRHLFETKGTENE